MDDKDWKEEELLKEINEEIGKQIADEIERDNGEGEQEDQGEPVKRRFKKRYLAFGLGGLALILVLTVVLIINGMLDRINHEKESDVQMAETDLSEEEYQAYLESLKNATPRPWSKAEDEVINILLIGEEAIESGGANGRSDSMIIASVNRVEKTLSLTSLMRDSYVNIPGYKPNKLNAALANGGGVLLSQTIEDSFGIQLDGYVRVDFDGFQKIIDMLGGIDIELTATEASYLNKTNYVSDRSNRNLSAGKNHMNGNQALGYCRVRYKAAGNGEKDDFGRTYRQRTVLTAVFDKYKAQNPVEMIKVASSLLDYVTTNLDKGQIINYMTIAAGLGTTELRSFRIPVQNGFKGADRHCGNSTKLYSVLLLDFDENIKQMREFIYGPALSAKLGPIPDGNQGVGINGTTGAGIPTYKPKPVYTAAPKPTVKPVPKPTPSPVPTQKPVPTIEPTEAPVQTEAPSTEPEPPVESVGPTPSAAPPTEPMPPTVTEPPAGQGDEGQTTPIPAASLPPEDAKPAA